MTLGQVMRDLARQKKLGAYQVARALDVYHTTVYAWWKDQYRPSPEKLKDYAKLMEVSMDEIERQSMPEPDRQGLADALFAILERIAGGEEPSAAFTAVARVPVTPDRRRAMQGAVEAFKRYLSEAGGVDWDEATPAEREAALQEFHAELNRYLLPTQAKLP